MWLLTSSIVSILTHYDTIVYFNPYNLDCNWHLHLASHIELYWIIIRCSYILSAMILIITSNICSLLIAAKHVNKRTGELIPCRSAVLTVSCICWVFVASFIPYFICMFVSVPLWFNTVAENTLAISIISNPIIYTLTNNRFRCFIKERVFRMITNTTTAQFRAIKF